MTIKNFNNEATNVSHPKISGDVYQWPDGRILVIDKSWAGMYLDWNAYWDYLKDAAADGGVLAMVELKGNPIIEIRVNGFFVSY